MSKYSYRQFVGYPYKGAFGCFRLVDAIYRDLYGHNLPKPSIVTTEKAHMQQLQDYLAKHSIEVGEPSEGDVILLKTTPWHVGVITEPGKMIHCYSGGSAVIEEYNTLHWQDCIAGFYRYVGF